MVSASTSVPSFFVGRTCLALDAARNGTGLLLMDHVRRGSHRSDSPFTNLPCLHWLIVGKGLWSSDGATLGSVTPPTNYPLDLLPSACGDQWGPLALPPISFSCVSESYHRVHSSKDDPKIGPRVVARSFEVIHHLRRCQGRVIYHELSAKIPSLRCTAVPDTVLKSSGTTQCSCCPY